MQVLVVVSGSPSFLSSDERTELGDLTGACVATEPLGGIPPTCLILERPKGEEHLLVLGLRVQSAKHARPPLEKPCPNDVTVHQKLAPKLDRLGPVLAGDSPVVFALGHFSEVAYVHVHECDHGPNIVSIDFEKLIGESFVSFGAVVGLLDVILFHARVALLWSRLGLRAAFDMEVVVQSTKYDLDCLHRDASVFFVYVGAPQSGLVVHVCEESLHFSMLGYDKVFMREGWKGLTVWAQTKCFSQDAHLDFFLDSTSLRILFLDQDLCIPIGIEDSDQHLVAR